MNNNSKNMDSFNKTVQNDSGFATKRDISPFKKLYNNVPPNPNITKNQKV